MRSLIIILFAACILSACATSEHAVQEPIHTAPAQESKQESPQVLATIQPQTARVDDPPLTLYPLYDDTPLMEMPKVEATRVEILNATDKLIRFKSQGNWAWVLDVASGRIGWTENRLLTGQPPSTEHTPGDGTISETF